MLDRYRGTDVLLYLWSLLALSSVSVFVKRFRAPHRFLRDGKVAIYSICDSTLSSLCCLGAVARLRRSLSRSSQPAGKLSRSLRPQPVLPSTCSRRHSSFLFCSGNMIGTEPLVLHSLLCLALLPAVLSWFHYCSGSILDHDVGNLDILPRSIFRVDLKDDVFLMAWNRSSGNRFEDLRHPRHVEPG
jgi:hypothetical protein